MEPERQKRKRNPLSREEVANIIAHNRRRELQRTEQLKKRLVYKLQNVFTVACFFIYVELTLCFFGPCTYAAHEVSSVIYHYGENAKPDGTPDIADVILTDVAGKHFHFIVDDYVDIPEPGDYFGIGTDYLLGKPLKGILYDGGRPYRLFAASPVIVLNVISIFIAFGAFMYDLNEKAYSLMALTVLNCLTMLGILIL